MSISTGSISPAITNSMGRVNTRPMGASDLPISQGFYIYDNVTTDYYLLDDVGGRLIIEG